MSILKSEECQICKKSFSRQDDSVEIVVCPICGAPYHRECYDSVKECVFENVHGTESDYCHLKDRNVSTSSHSSLEAYDNFGGGNDLENKDRLDNLGVSEGDLKKLKNIRKNVVKVKNGYKSKKKDGERDFFGSDREGCSFDEENFHEGVSVFDFAKFVFFNSKYYLESFKRIKEKNRSRFNFCAFWFPAAWFLYRKQYKIGSFLLILSSIFSVIVSFLRVRVLPPIVKQIFGSNALSFSDFSFFSYFDFSESFSRLTFIQKVLVFLPSISEVLTLIVMFLVGFFANKIYFRFCTNKIKSIKSKFSPGAEYDFALIKEGGVNHKALILAIVCYLVVNYLPGFFVK